MAKNIAETSIFKDMGELQKEFVKIRPRLSKESINVWENVFPFLSIDTFKLFYITHKLTDNAEKAIKIQELYVNFRTIENNITIISSLEYQQRRGEAVFGESGPVVFIDILARLEKACEGWEDYVKDVIRKQGLPKV